MHIFKHFEASLGLFAIDDDKHKIGHADCDKSHKMHNAHGYCLDCAVAPECEHSEHDQRDCKIYARAIVLVFLDDLLIHVLVADDVARIAETHAEILHPAVAQGLRSFGREAMRREIADVVVIDLIHVGEIFFDFFACIDELASARAEIGQRNDDAYAHNHRHHDDEVGFEIDLRQTS